MLCMYNYTMYATKNIFWRRFNDVENVHNRCGEIMINVGSLTYKQLERRVRMRTLDSVELKIKNRGGVVTLEFDGF